MAFALGSSPVGSISKASSGDATKTASTASVSPDSAVVAEVTSTQYAQYLASLGLTYQQIQDLTSAKSGAILDSAQVEALSQQSVGAITSVTSTQVSPSDVLESTTVVDRSDTVEAAIEQLSQDSSSAGSAALPSSGVAGDVATAIRDLMLANGLMTPTDHAALASAEIVANMYGAGFSFGDSIAVSGMLAQASDSQVGIIGIVDATGNVKFAVTSGLGDVPGVTLASDAALVWKSTPSALAGTADLLLVRDGPDILALRRGANAQEFRIYLAHSDESTAVALGKSSLANAFGITLAGDGAASDLAIVNNIGGDVGIYTGPAGGALLRWSVDVDGNQIPAVDNTLNIGSADLRVKEIHATDIYGVLHTQPADFETLMNDWLDGLPTAPDAVAIGDWWNNGGTPARVVE